MSKPKLLFIIVSLVLMLTYCGPPKYSSYYGWVKILDKEIDESFYSITADTGERNIEIAGKIIDTFTYENSEYDTYDVHITQVWDILEEDEKVFVDINTNIFRSAYKIEKLYEY